MSPIGPMESTIDMNTGEEPSYRPGGCPVRSAGSAKPERTLKHCINEIHGRGGNAVRHRRLTDSPISHLNTWERVASHPTYDTLSGVYDGGGAGVPETPTSDQRISGALEYIKGDTQSGVFDGGGDRGLETLPAASGRLRKAYIIRVDNLTHMNDSLRDTRDKLREDQRGQLKCAAATQSDDSVAAE